MRDAGNEARLERWRKVLGRAVGVVGREGSLQSASGEEGAAPARKEGKWPDSANQRDEVGEQTGMEETHKARPAIIPGIDQ